MMANKHKTDKDTSNDKNVKDLTSYDKKLIDQQNDFNERLR